MRLELLTDRKGGFDSSEQARYLLLIASMGSKVAGHCSYDVRACQCSMLNTRYRLDALATEASSYVEMTSQVSGKRMTTRAVSIVGHASRPEAAHENEPRLAAPSCHGDA